MNKNDDKLITMAVIAFRGIHAQATAPNHGRLLEMPRSGNVQLKKRIRKLMSVLIKETWLPIALRSHIAEKVSLIQGVLDGRRRGDLALIVREMHSILALSMDGNAWSHSEITAHLEMLDMELNASDSHWTECAERCAS